MYKVHVPLAERSYDIHIQPQILDEASSYLNQRFEGRNCFTIMDENIVNTQWPRLKAALEKSGFSTSHLILPQGEATKSYPYFQQIVETLLEAKIERQDFVIALGGGVIGDIVGFAASSVRRGIGFVQIPTSLLAQVDSSVGGKTGINSPHGKNLIGAFYQPQMVLIDPTSLNTLSERHKKAGYAEVLKYALINNVAFYDWLEANGANLFQDQALLCEAIRMSVQSKADIVAQDEREGGVRALLNLGHTFGHALEKLTHYSERLVHGEGVAIGMVLAMGFSQQQGLFQGQDLTRITRHLQHMGLPTKISDIQGGITSPEDMLQAMYQDKKVEQGQLNLILSKGIGEAFMAKNINGQDVLKFLEQNF